MGPARSSSPHAYRSESYGLLSLLCFLHPLAEFTGKHEPWFGIVATDSQSLIDTVFQTPSVDLPQRDRSFRESLSTVCKTPLEPTIPEWDVICGIQVLLFAMPDVKLQHVRRGHQDRRTPYSQLPLLAQLNVDADAQASKYQCEYGSFQLNVLLTEWTGVHLVFPTGTVTSHYETALRYQATAKPLQDYMRERYSWTPQVLAVVKWGAHSKAMQRHMHNRTHLVKLVHGILPINARLHRSDARQNTCPSCKTAVETWQHILQCPSASYTAWQESMLQAVATKCDELHTMPRLKTLLLQALRVWFIASPDDPPFQMLPTKGDTMGVRCLVFQQNSIGIW
jgi:hypothetical protein